jgi:hypothetical protein
LINDHLWDRRFVKSIVRNAERCRMCVLPLVYKKGGSPAIRFIPSYQMMNWLR